jgi:hypothetical protein
MSTSFYRIKTLDKARLDQSVVEDEAYKERWIALQRLPVKVVGITFSKTAWLLKRFSAVSSPTGQEVVVPVEVRLNVQSVRHVNEEFLPSYAISDIREV